MGLAIKQGRREHCPVCDPGKQHRENFIADRERWYCHRCNKGGDVFTLMLLVSGTNFKEAIRILTGEAPITNAERRLAAPRTQENQLEKLRDAEEKELLANDHRWKARYDEIDLMYQEREIDDVEVAMLRRKADIDWERKLDEVWSRYTSDIFYMRHGPCSVA
jgi:phage/plasmid primase-like uncharacterized protein